MHGEPGFRQHALQIGQRAAVLRRHRTAADKIAGDGDGIGGHGQSPFAGPFARTTFGSLTRPSRAPRRIGRWLDQLQLVVQGCQTTPNWRIGNQGEFSMSPATQTALATEDETDVAALTAPPVAMFQGYDSVSGA